MIDNCGQCVECMGLSRRCGEQEAGVASGRGCNLHPLHINFSGYILMLEWPYDQLYPTLYMILFLPLIHQVCFYPSREGNIKLWHSYK